MLDTGLATAYSTNVVQKSFSNVHSQELIVYRAQIQSIAIKHYIVALQQMPLVHTHRPAAINIYCLTKCTADFQLFYLGCTSITAASRDTMVQQHSSCQAPQLGLCVLFHDIVYLNVYYQNSFKSLYIYVHPGHATHKAWYKYLASYCGTPGCNLLADCVA